MSVMVGVNSDDKNESFVCPLCQIALSFSQEAHLRTYIEEGTVTG